MANKRPKPEEIISKIRQVEVLMGQGMPRLDAIRQISIAARLRVMLESRKLDLSDKVTRILKRRIIAG